MLANSVYHFVISSAVRVNILSLLASTPATPDGLIEELDASKSSVYTALTDLEERNVLRKHDDSWVLTGKGRLILDAIEQLQSMDSVLERDREYWETHRTDVIPREFRRRLPELGDYEVVRSEPPNVRAHARASISLLESADSCNTAVPVHVPEYSEAFPYNPDSRVIHPPAVFEQFQREVQAGNREQLRVNDDVPHRVRELQFGMSVAESFMMMALRSRGESMIDSVLISKTDSAIQWASDLYDHLWRTAEPIDSYLEREHDGTVE